MIERYLRELSQHLHVGRKRRGRILAEVEAHLRDDGGDADAIARFGSPEEVAMRFNDVHRTEAPRLAAGLVLVSALVVFGAVQGLERHIPPAPWPEGGAPGHLDTLFTHATGAILVALAAALATLVLPRAARAPLALVSTASLVVCAALLLAHALERTHYVSGSPAAWWPALLAVGAALPALTGAGLVVHRWRS